MSFKRMWVMFNARNKEFFRDSTALGWNFLFPFLIIAGFGILFGGKEYEEFKVGVFSQLTLAMALDARKRWSVEIYGRYDYVPSFTVSNGATSSTVNASSFGGGMGVGFRF